MTTNLLKEGVQKNYETCENKLQEIGISNNYSLTLYLLTWRIRWAPNNASKGQMEFNLAFKGL